MLDNQNIKVINIVFMQIDSKLYWMSSFGWLYMIKNLLQNEYPLTANKWMLIFIFGSSILRKINKLNKCWGLNEAFVDHLHQVLMILSRVVILNHFVAFSNVKPSHSKNWIYSIINFPAKLWIKNSTFNANYISYFIENFILFLTLLKILY